MPLRLGDADAETAAVLLEADVDDRPFAPAVHACVPPLPWGFNGRGCSRGVQSSTCVRASSQLPAQLLLYLDYFYH